MYVSDLIKGYCSEKESKLHLYFNHTSFLRIFLLPVLQEPNERVWPYCGCKTYFPTQRLLPIMIHSIMTDCAPQSMREKLIICLLLISCPVAGSLHYGTNPGCSHHWHTLIATQETFRRSSERTSNHDIQKRKKKFGAWYCHKNVTFPLLQFQDKVSRLQP